MHCIASYLRYEIYLLKYALAMDSLVINSYYIIRTAAFAVNSFIHCHFHHMI